MGRVVFRLRCKRLHVHFERLGLCYGSLDSLVHNQR